MQLNIITYLWTYLLTLFVRSFGSQQGTGLRPSEVVRVVRRAMGDWLTTPPGSKRTTKTGKTVISVNKKMKNEANLNPIYSEELFSGILRITKKPYFAKRTQFQQGGLHPNLRNNKEIRQITPKPPPQKRTQNEPNTNPIRTQYEPNTNPIRTQFEPKANPISAGRVEALAKTDPQKHLSHRPEPRFYLDNGHGSIIIPSYARSSVG